MDKELREMLAGFVEDTVRQTGLLLAAAERQNKALGMAQTLIADLEARVRVLEGRR